MTYKYDHVFNIIAETSGKIIKINNNELSPFDYEIEKGMQIDDLMPIFLGIFPLSSEEITLEKVSLNKFIGNIFIQTNHQEVRICFFDEPEMLNEWQEIYQKHNQDKLITNLVMKNKDNTIPSDILISLGLMGFEKTTDGYLLFANVPKWFRKIFPDYNYSSSIFALEELFPFLEVFLPETDVLFSTTNHSKIYSGLWTVAHSNNEETILQAIAVNTSQKKYIFIESVSERNPEKQKNLQKSRELSLKHQQLVKTEEALRELLKYREQFISIFSHDIKSPLAGSYSLIDLLKEDDEFMSSFSEEYANIFDVIHRNLKGILDYSDQLYDWSNLNFSKINVNLSKTNIHDMMVDIITNFTEKIQHKNMSVQYNIPPNLEVNVDSVFFKNAMQNIISNAIKFSYHNGELTISVNDLDECTQIQIKDTGVGMSDETIKTIFDYDTKVSTYGTDGEKGTGIGLNIVKRILDIHDAKITIESELQKGSCFTIKVPKQNLT